MGIGNDWLHGLEKGARGLEAQAKSIAYARKKGKISGAKTLGARGMEAGKAEAPRAKSTLEMLGSALHAFFASIGSGVIELFARFIETESTVSEPVAIDNVLKKEAFSPEFNQALYEIYSEKIPDDEAAPMILDGVDVGICKFSWTDFQRFNIELEDETGSRPLCDKTVDPYPGDADGQNKWKLRQIGKLLSFCGGDKDKDKLMKLSQLWLNQTIGNGHMAVVVGDFSNQKLVQEGYIGDNFTILEGSKYSDVKKFTKIIKEKDVIVGIEYRVEAQVGGVVDQRSGDKKMLKVDKEKSPYFLSIKLSLNPTSLELDSSASVSGQIGYNIHILEEFK